MENTLNYPEPCDLHWEPTETSDSKLGFSLMPLFLLLITGCIVWLFLQMKKEEHRREQII